MSTLKYIQKNLISPCFPSEKNNVYIIGEWIKMLSRSTSLHKLLQKTREYVVTTWMTKQKVGTTVNLTAIIIIFFKILGLVVSLSFPNNAQPYSIKQKLFRSVNNRTKCPVIRAFDRASSVDRPLFQALLNTFLPWGLFRKLYRERIQ